MAILSGTVEGNSSSMMTLPSAVGAGSISSLVPGLLFVTLAFLHPGVLSHPG